MKNLIVKLTLSAIPVLLVASSIAFGCTCSSDMQTSGRTPCDCIYSDCAGYYTINYSWSCTGTCPSDENCEVIGTTRGMVIRKWPCFGDCDPDSPDFNKGCDFGTGSSIYGNVPVCECV